MRNIEHIPSANKENLCYNHPFPPKKFDIDGITFYILTILILSLFPTVSLVDVVFADSGANEGLCI